MIFLDFEKGFKKLGVRVLGKMWIGFEGVEKGVWGCRFGDSQ
jgi:hypothetical protein